MELGLIDAIGTFEETFSRLEAATTTSSQTRVTMTKPKLSDAVQKGGQQTKSDPKTQETATPAGEAESSTSTQETATQAADDDEPAGSQTTATGDVTESSVLAKLDRFCEEFGTELGTQCFRKGLTYEQALGEHNRVLQTELNGEREKNACLLYTSPSPRDLSTSRMPSSA